MTCRLMWLLVTALTLIYAWKPQEVLRPGALIAPIGRILLVKDVISIHLDLMPLETQLTSIQNLQFRMIQAKGLTDRLIVTQPNMTDAERMILEMQKNKLDDIISRIWELKKTMPGFNERMTRANAARRSKRGLFNFMGEVSKALFGTAMGADVDTLGRKQAEIITKIAEQGKVIKVVYKNIMKLGDNVQEILTQTNIISSLLSKTASEVVTLEALLLLSEYLSSCGSVISKIESNIHTILEDFIDAGLGRVNSRLLPIPTLRSALEIAIKDYSLEPIFNLENLEYYYPLLDAQIVESFILIHIPLKSKHYFTSFIVEPFPLLSSGRVVKLNRQAELVIISDDSEWYDHKPLSALTECKMSHQSLHICPAYTFDFKNQKLSACEASLIFNDTATTVRECSFREVDTSVHSRVHMLGRNYFYFHTLTVVTLVCNGQASHASAKGFYECPDYCEIIGGNFTTFPTRHHTAFTGNITLALIPFDQTFEVNLSDISVVSERLTVLSHLNGSEFEDILDVTLPSYLAQEILLPSVFIPVIATVCGIILVICCIARIAKKYETLKKA